FPAPLLLALDVEQLFGEVGSFHVSSPCYTSGPGLVPGAVLSSTYEDVDGRDPSTPGASTGFECRSAEALAKAGKPGHDACGDSSFRASGPNDAIISSGLPIRTTGTLRGS